MISPSQRPLPDNKQHSQQTNIHAPGGIRTHDLSRRAAVDLRLRPRGHWDRQFFILLWAYYYCTWCTDKCISNIIHIITCILIWCDFDRASSLICGNKMPTRCTSIASSWHFISTYMHTYWFLILCIKFLVARAQTEFCKGFPQHIKGWTYQVNRVFSI